MSRNEGSRVLYVLPGPLDKLAWSFILMTFFCIINVLVRADDDMKTGYFVQQYHNLYNFCNGNHLMIYCLGNMIVTVVAYWIIGAGYTFIDVLQKPDLLTGYRTQPEKYLGLKNPPIWKCVRRVFVNQLITIPFSIVNFAFSSKFGNMDFNPRNVPTFLTLFFDMIVNSTAIEIGFYCTHRLMHQPYLYKKIHKTHHEYVAPIGISFFYSHPLEHLIGILIPFVLGQYIRPAHVMSFYLWIIISIFNGINEHSGYHFPMFASPEFHAYHHARFNQNYGLLGLMDWFHGTSNEFTKSKASERHFCFYGSTPLRDAIPDHAKDCKRKVDNNSNKL